MSRRDGLAGLIVLTFALLPACRRESGATASAPRALPSGIAVAPPNAEWNGSEPPPIGGTRPAEPVPTRRTPPSTPKPPVPPGSPTSL